MDAVSIIDARGIDINETQARSLAQVRQVSAGTQMLEFQTAGDDAVRHAWVERVLRRSGSRPGCHAVVHPLGLRQVWPESQCPKGTPGRGWRHAMARWLQPPQLSQVRAVAALHFLSGLEGGVKARLIVDHLPHRG